MIEEQYQNTGRSCPSPETFLINPKLDPTIIIGGYIGKDIHFKSSCASIWLQILGGFMAALGALAIVVALTLLTPPATVVAVSGAAALVVGQGMFKIGKDKPKELSPDNSVNWCPSF